MTRNATTAMLSSTSPIRPTELERLHGRIMRSPDHDAATCGDEPVTDAPADTPAEDGSLMSDAKPGDEDLDNAADGTGGDDAADDSADKPEDDEKPAADEGLPEKYELEMPEGVELDQTLLDEATPVLHELGLGNEQAQKLVPIVAKIQETVLGRLNENFQAQATDWAKQAKADPILGGGKWKETEHLVALAMDRIGPRLPPVIRQIDGKDVEVTGPEQVQEFRDLLAETKLGNHPTLIRMFRFYGQAISEDSNFIRADGAAPVKASREEVLYPDDVRKGTN